MKFGTGNAWARRRIANPLDTGSIPARASILRSRLTAPPSLRGYWPRQFWYWLGVRAAWWAAWRGAGGYRSFASGLVDTLALLGAAQLHDSPANAYQRQKAALAESAVIERDRYKAEMVRARQELSKIKRKLPADDTKEPKK